VLRAGYIAPGHQQFHWQAARCQTGRPIAPQFEFNRFTRAWHQSHPGASRAEALRAWRAYRALPAEVIHPGTGGGIAP
jgi:hypothetical protein